MERGVLLRYFLTHLDQMFKELSSEIQEAVVSEIEKGSVITFGMDSQQFWFEFDGVRYLEER